MASSGSAAPAASQETALRPPHNSLIVMQLRNIRTAQKNSRGAVFAAGPFDALLVGACGVQAWSAPLVRLLSADARKVVESFLRPRITERAATVLRVAAEKFLTGVFHSALMVAIDCRNATTVWACDIENAIKICGLDRVAGTGRPHSGCACAGTGFCDGVDAARAARCYGLGRGADGARRRVAPPTDDVVRGGSARRFVGAERYPSIDAVDRVARGRAAPGTWRAQHSRLGLVRFSIYRRREGPRRRAPVAA